MNDILINWRRRLDFIKEITELLENRGNLDKIKEMIETSNRTNLFEGQFDLNWGNDDMNGLSMLAQACMSGQIEYVRWLLQQGCDPWIKNVDGETIFHMAILQTNVRDKIEYGPDDTRPPNSAMGVITTLLHHIEGVEWRYNINFDERIWELRDFWHKTPLDFSARKGGAEVLKFFISEGAQINGPLYSTQYGSIPNDERDAMIERPGGDGMYTQFGSSLLHQAIEFGNNDAFDVLMDDGAYTHVYDAKGETPLMCAIRYLNFHALERLITSPGIDLSQVHGHVFEFVPEIGTYWITDPNA